MSDDGFQHFLTLAADHRLLNAGEEKALARVIQTQPDDRHNCERCPACLARRQLVLCNVRLVVSVARYYRNRGMPPEDVVQEGIVGLDRAARKFDPGRNIRFSTYATLWIKQAIQRALLGRGSTIRLPSAVAGNRAKVRNALLKEPGRDAVALAEELDLTPAEVERALEAAEVVTSLDREMVTDESMHTLLDSIPDLFAVEPHDSFGVEDTQGLVPALDTLEDLTRDATGASKHRRVIELRFGLAGRDPLYPKEIAEALGMSTNTVKTLQAEALEILATEVTTVRERGLLDSVPV